MFFLDFSPTPPPPTQLPIVVVEPADKFSSVKEELNKVPEIPLKTGIYKGTTASVFTPDTQKSLIAGEGLASQHFNPPGGNKVVFVSDEQSNDSVKPVPVDLTERLNTLNFSQKVPELETPPTLPVPAPPPKPVAPTQVPPAPPAPPAPVDVKIWEVDTYRWMFDGGSNSFLAKVIGGPEGTRTPDGGYTPAFNQHTDFGNGKRNQGSFSYQHEASSPEQADENQLKKLEKQLAILLQQAKELGVQPTPLWVVAALDLATQSPTSALGKGGTNFASRGFAATTADLVVLNPAINGNFSKEDLIEARVKTYINPQTGNWTSTGLKKLNPDLRKATTANQKQRVSLLVKYSKAHGTEL